jgi:uncharacterized membrane protein SpoIIM required for sporulation
MRVAERLARRESAWRELDRLLVHLADRRKLSAGEALRLGELYRSACTDLMLADDHDLPRETVAHLQALVARAHNLVYRASGFQFRDLGRALFQVAPRSLRHDPALRLATAVFWGVFLFSALLAAGRPEFAPQIVGEATLERADHEFAQPLSGKRNDGQQRNDTFMTGFYIQHNASIGLQCYAWGILLGLGSLYQLFWNALHIGAQFGYMATRPHATHFFEFVTAHSSFELTAICISGAAGLRMGWGLIDTQGQSRLSSLRREAANALPAVGVAVVLFVLAALVEGYVSASSLPYWTKAAVAILSGASILAYLALGGRGEPVLSAGRPELAIDPSANA